MPLSPQFCTSVTSTETDSNHLYPPVLHLGNIYFHRAPLKHGQEGVEIGSDAEVRWLGHLLGIETDWVRRALMTRTTVSRELELGTVMSVSLGYDYEFEFDR